MHRDVDDAVDVEPVIRPLRVICACGVPFGRVDTSQLRLCPRCDISPPLIAA